MLWTTELPNSLPEVVDVESLPGLKGKLRQDFREKRSVEDYQVDKPHQVHEILWDESSWKL